MRDFSYRCHNKLAESDVFSLKLNPDAALAAVSFFDGSLQIVAPAVGEKIYEIKDDDMFMPITSLSWKPTRDVQQSSQRLIGACLDGSIIRWTFDCRNTVERIKLNRDQRYHAIDYAGDQRRFCVAGTQPYIEIYDEERMQRVQ